MTEAQVDAVEVAAADYTDADHDLMDVVDRVVAEFDQSAAIPEGKWNWVTYPGWLIVNAHLFTESKKGAETELRQLVSAMSTGTIKAMDKVNRDRDVPSPRPLQSMRMFVSLFTLISGFPFCRPLATDATCKGKKQFFLVDITLVQHEGKRALHFACRRGAIMSAKP